MVQLPTRAVTVLALLLMDFICVNFANDSAFTKHIPQTPHPCGQCVYYYYVYVLMPVSAQTLHYIIRFMAS